MTSRRAKVIAATLLGAGLLAPLIHSNTVAAALKTPSCEDFLAWAQTLDPKDRWQLNSTNEQLTLPAIFKGPEVEALFGLPISQWSLDDAQAARNQAKTCGREAGKAKQRKERRAFIDVQKSLSNELVGTLKKIDLAQKDLETNWQALTDLPASTKSLRTLGVLRRVEAGGAMSQDDLVLLAGDGKSPEFEHGQRIVMALGGLPDQATETLRPEIDRRYEEMRPQVVEAVQQELASAPATQDGLGALEEALTSAQADLGPVVPEQDLAAIEKTAADRRAAIEESLASQ